MECFRKIVHLHWRNILQTCLNPCCNGMLSKGYKWIIVWSKADSLNPCCNGMLLKVKLWNFMVLPKWCLNPCCNGMLLKEEQFRKATKSLRVLILVVMECLQAVWLYSPTWVLILVVMECFWKWEWCESWVEWFVLILVVMECFWKLFMDKMLSPLKCLNPCCNGMLLKDNN